MPFDDLRSFLRFLEAQGELRRITAEVDPELEITEIACRTVRQQGPALLFENVKGARFPLLINALGTARRIEWALGRPPEQVGDELKAFAEDMMPPRPAALWKHRRLLLRALKMRPRFGSDGPVLQVSEPPDLDALPALKCWPDDGGRFITFPLVLTKNPANGRRNLGLYRMHVYDKTSTGMHWQIQKGGGFHYAEAERRSQPLPAAVALGADPILMLAGALPLPEDMDELAFAGFLRGRSTRLTSLRNGLDVPAMAEMVLEGVVAPEERRTEGPFGDHFGHYSQAAPFPVFRIHRFHHRKDAIYPAAVVGKPPQEDKYMGNAVQEMLLPLLKVMRPELTDLWAYFEAGFHNLAVASVRQRYGKEAVKTALGLLGEGEMSLTKCIILVDPDVPVRRFEAVLEALRQNFDPKEDLLLLPGTAQDTLDFTSFTMNLGSKMVLDATSGGRHSREPRRPSVPSDLGPGVLSFRNWGDALLAVQVKHGGRAVVERLVQDPRLADFKLIAAVSDDVPLQDAELLLWGIFTRFDCARDLVPAKAHFRGGRSSRDPFAGTPTDREAALGQAPAASDLWEKGGWPVYEGPLGLDATWKQGYPAPLVMDPDIIKRVDRRWGEYGL